jgi:hypothetical protein
MLEPSKTIPRGLPPTKNVAAVFAPYHRNSANRFAFDTVADAQLTPMLLWAPCEYPQTDKKATDNAKTLFIALGIMFASCELASLHSRVRFAHALLLAQTMTDSNGIPCGAQPNSPQWSFGIST